MPSVGKIFKTGFFIVAGLGVLIAIVLGLILAFQKERISFDQRLAALPAAERAVLDQLVKTAGIAISDLRDVGRGAASDDERNFKAIAVEGGTSSCSPCRI